MVITSCKTIQLKIYALRLAIFYLYVLYGIYILLLLLLVGLFYY